MPRLEGQIASEGPQPVTLKFAVHTGAHSQSYANELDTPKELRDVPLKEVTLPTAQLRCLNTNAHCMDNKEEKLEATILLESCYLVAIPETW